MALLSDFDQILAKANQEEALVEERIAAHRAAVANISKEKNMKKILVIEDRPEEQAKARQALDETDGVVGCVAEDLHEVYTLLGEAEKARQIFPEGDEPSLGAIEWDAVITDLHFPILTGSRNLDEGKAENPIGLEIVLYCRERGIPVVICTDVDHHRSAWIKRIAEMIGVQVVDDKGRFDAWKRAIDLAVEKCR